jgi:PPOX class probable F420-dependent enzyme
MDLAKALDFARTHRRSVLVTQRRNGRPQLSNVMHHMFEDGTIKISITADRAKYKNLAREPWAALHLTSADFWSWVVLEGTVELSEVAQRPDDATVDELVEYYRAASGEHPDWDEYRAAMVAEHRVMARLRPDSAYGQLG